MHRLVTWRRAAIGLLIVTTVLVAFAVPFWQLRTTRSEVARRVAELDRDEPGWDLRSRIDIANVPDPSMQGPYGAAVTAWPYLQLAAVRAAERGDAGRAGRLTRVTAALWRGVQNPVSSLGVDIRSCVVEQGISATERALDVARLPEADLAALQREFALISERNLAEDFAVAERALAFACYDFDLRVAGNTWIDPLDKMMTANGQAFMLGVDTRLVAATRLPPPRHHDAAADVLSAARNNYHARFGYTTAPVNNSRRESAMRSAFDAQGAAGIAVAGIACERYRLRTGRWPDSLGAIPADLLADVPADPTTGDGVTYRRAADGVSLTIPSSETPPTFRLYDPDKRDSP